MRTVRADLKEHYGSGTEQRACRMRRDKDYCVLSTGRRFYANNGIIGIDDDGNISEGYDGGIHTEGYEWPDEPEPPWTPAERAELADEMIRRWEAFKHAR